MITIKIKPNNIASKFKSFKLDDPIKRAVKIVTFRLEAKGKQQAQKMIYAQPLSKSGYKRTGRLLGSIRGNPSNMTGKVVADVEYAGYVHWGTRYMKSRPFFVRAVEEEQKELEKLTGGQIEIGINNHFN